MTADAPAFDRVVAMADAVDDVVIVDVLGVGVGVTELLRRQTLQRQKVC